jgi:hypothetical protein
MLDINKNLETLFDTKEFYKIISERDGRTVLYGTLTDLKELRTGETLESALKYIKKIRARTGYGPILIYLMGSDHTKDIPYCAISDRNPLCKNGIYFFNEGHYLTDEVHPVALEILNTFMREYEDVEPEKINFGNLDSSHESPYMTKYQEYLENILDTKNYYAISDFFVAKEENGELKAAPMDVCMSYNLEVVLKDQRHEETYEYPIVVFKVIDDNTLLEPAFVIHNIDEEPLILEFIKGYYREPADKSMTIDYLIDNILENEVRAFTRPQKPTIKVQCSDGILEKPNPDYMEIPS